MSCSGPVVLPFLPQQPKHSQLHWNLWLTLETGRRSLKADVGPPTVIVSRPSHPFSPLAHTAPQLRTSGVTAGRGERARDRGHHGVEPQRAVGNSGRELLEAADGQNYLSAIKTVKINDFFHHFFHSKAPKI